MRVFFPLRSLVSQGNNDSDLDFFSFSLLTTKTGFFVFRRWKGGWAGLGCSFLRNSVSASGS